MILFVDLEHVSAHDMPHGDIVLSWRTRITYRLQEIAKQTCLLQHYTAIDQARVDALGVEAIFLSGSSTDPDRYGDTLEGVREVIRKRRLPIFGFCGGFQFMMETHGSPLQRIGRLADGEKTDFPEYMTGWRTETGYHPVSVTAEHDLVTGLGVDPVFRHFHGWEVRKLPEGFVNLASTDTSAVQMVVDDGSKQVGTQFHPEYYTNDHPAGRVLIENFCRWAGLSS